MMKKILCFTLIFIMLISVFACGDGENKTNDNKPGDDTGTINETASERLYPDVPDITYDDAEFKILGTSEAYGFGYYQTKDVWVSEMNGEAFNDAIVERNRALEEQLKIEIVYSDSADVYSAVSKAVASGEYAYDLVYGSWGDCVALAKGGFTINMNNMKYLDFGNPWWDGNVIKQCGIANKVYYISGDLSTLVNNCTRFVYFNKKLVGMYDLKSPYEYVHGNDWTFDNFSAMAKSVYDDLNGDGLFNEGDRFGLFREGGMHDFFFLGCGQVLTKLDKDGYPQISVMNDQTFIIIEKIFNMLYDTNACINIDEFKNIGGYSNRYAYARGLFTQDLMLFTISGTLILSEFRDMESDFGMIPFPKYSGEQENYRQYVDGGTNMICVPKTTLDEERTAIVMEVMAVESKYILKPAYYDVVLKRKYMRDNESEDMLDIIYGSKVFMLEITESLGGLFGVMASAYSGKRIPLASDYEKVMESSLTAIEKTYNIYLDLE
ncbi:MAG: ABC transporter substrate-binding protein [Oscillospiraceae bacterium]|nr:ABC transporter substrate-binding protein [Oscillospiraceae bacterium]